MFKLLILADDFTGALDTGVQFSSRGITTVVYDKPFVPDHDFDGDEVLVLNMETRHESPRIAYEKIRHVANRAKDIGIAALYIKTDSGMRGNIGASLEAAATAWGGNLAFVPAYPQAGRTIENGNLFINGMPVTQSIFGQDLYNPVLHDNVREIISQQTDMPVIDANLELHPNQGAILLYEAQTVPQMARIAHDIGRKAEVSIFAGCAGFAAYLPEVLGISAKEKRQVHAAGPVLVISGSTSSVSLEQMNAARVEGIPSILFDDIIDDSPDYASLSKELADVLKRGPAMLESAWDEGGVKALTIAALSAGLSIEQTGERIAANFGAAIRQIYDSGFCGTLCIFGGDTLAGVMRTLGVKLIRPLAELGSGVALSEMELNGKVRYLVTKSGSFGDNREVLRILSNLERLEVEREIMSDQNLQLAKSKSN